MLTFFGFPKQKRRPTTTVFNQSTVLSYQSYNLKEQGQGLCQISEKYPTIFFTFVDIVLALSLKLLKTDSSGNLRNVF